MTLSRLIGGLAFVGGLVFVGKTGELQLVDISNPVAPIEIAVVKTPRSVTYATDVTVVDPHAHRIVVESLGGEFRLEYFAKRQHLAPLAVVPIDRQNHDVRRRQPRWEHKTVVVGVRHNESADQTGRHAPRSGPGINLRARRVLEFNFLGFGEILSEEVRRAGLQRFAILHHRFDAVGGHRARKPLAGGLFAFDHGHCHRALGEFSVDVENQQHLFHGFRLGGTNNRGIGAIQIPEEFAADELTNYEFGIKSMLGGRRTTLNASVFLMEWENLQVAGQDPTGAFGFIGNAGTAEVHGIEVELASALGDSFYITGQVTYLAKKELTEDQVSDEVVAPGLAGDQLARVPEFTAAFTAQYSYELPIQGWDGAVRLEGSYTDSSFTELRPDAAANRFQDSYSIVNFRANFRSQEMDLDLAFFIENMFDERGDVFIGGGSGGQPTSKITNRPQTFGVRVTKGFGRL